MFYVTVKKGEHKALFTDLEIKRGDIFMNLLEGQLTTKRSRTSIQVDKGLHIEHIAAQFINHSFDPNCTVLDHALIATRDIYPGEEILLDYTINEDNISNPFKDNETGDWVGKKKNYEKFRNVS